MRDYNEPINKKNNAFRFGDFAMLMTAAAAAVLAVFQFFLDTVLFRAVFAGKALKAIGLLLVKLALYGGGFALLFLCFRAYVTGAAIGFGVGFFPAILVYGLIFVKRGFSVGSHQSEVGSPPAAQKERE